MRRSSVVQLTLLPMLATAAVAAGQPGPDQDPQSQAPGATDPAADATTSASQQPTGADGDVILEPPGMTPTIIELDCADDPNWRLRADCVDVDDVVVVRGGFGGYFWSSHG
ncbi:MAG TPA: hypothetical protein VMJ10_04315 [Kofleriaceae bacterium]|nr:hypothetical protein [Kofleriaceae bacterium]